MASTNTKLIPVIGDKQKIYAPIFTTPRNNYPYLLTSELRTITRET